MLTNTEITFAVMADRLGEVVAYQCLEQIERAARIQPQRAISNPETRLANAIRVQDSMCRSHLLMVA